MRRRDFLKSTGAAAAAAGTATVAQAASHTPQPDQRKIAPDQEHPLEVRLTSDWPAQVAGPADLAHRFALTANQLAGDRLKLVAPGMTASNTATETPQEGSSDSLPGIHFGSLDKLSKDHPELAYITGLPGDTALPGEQLHAWIRYGGGQAAWDATAERFEQKAILAAHLGPGPNLVTTRPISALSDLRGLRLAAAGPTASLARALGAEPIEIDLHEAAELFAAGAIEAMEIAPMHALALGLERYANFAYPHLLRPEGQTLSAMIPLDLWHALALEQRTALTTAASDLYQASLAEARFAQNTAVSAMSGRYSVTLSDLPEDVTRAARQLAETVVADIASRDTNTARMNSSFMGFKAGQTARSCSGSTVPTA